MKKSNIIMIIGALLILGLFKFPLWNITLEAPQYPQGLGMDIFINDFVDKNPHDIKNINLMNHYVGMQYIPESIPEFKIFPVVIIIMSVFGVLIGIFKNYKWFVAWFTLMVILAASGIYDFYLWEHDYGHNLDPKAIMKFTNPDGSVMGFQPPLFGTKEILNFTAHSYPQLGAYFLAFGMAFSFLAFVVGRNERISISNKAGISKVISLMFLCALLSSGCTVKPKEIYYGEDVCDYCSMTIVDRQHAAQLVTEKGKVYKFDATECMINHIAENKAPPAFLLVTDYSQPEKLIDARKATFIISENIPSPMSANLSALASQEIAHTLKEEKGGTLYTWQELLQNFKRD